jgi:putative aldouronate transport system substrate-binding protein
MKSQAFEFQCTCEVGKEGAGKISTAIGLGTIKHPLLAIAENPWYTSVPTVLPTTKEDNQALGNLTDLTEKFGTAKDSDNVLVNIIAQGFTQEGMTSAESAVDYVKDTMGGAQYLDIKELAWEDLLDYYTSLN